MASKKYKLLLAVMLLASGAFAQQQPEKSTQIYNIYDSTIIPDKKMPQQNEFWNNAYSFPAKPRNMWEVGVSGGAFNVFGDVSTQFLTGGFGVHVRKAFGYVFSLRLQYLYGTAKGMNWKASENFGKNPAWNAYNAPTIGGGSTIPGQPYDMVYYNYKNVTQDLGLQGIININNIRFHKAKTNIVFYAGLGLGATAYETKINALDANGNPYSQLFASVFNSTSPDYENRKDIKNLLEDGMDDSYETDAQTLGNKRATSGGNTLRFSTTVLGGMAYRLSKRINIALEDRHTFMKDDLLDGQQYQESPLGDAVLTGSWDSYNYLSLGINFNIGGNSVEPLWWVNPLDYAYDEINNPKHMKLPKPVFEDADGDGVIDQLDREPNTPAGCPVDTHGVSLDTDGDGVPDCKDKQLITPTECQPVDADGVGKCPDPECCKNIGPAPSTCPCDYPSISFKGSASTLANDAKSMLATVAAKMKANPNCNIAINGYPEASKASQANCQKRVNAAKQHLVEKEGISADRIITNCEVGGGDKNTVDIKCQ